MRKKIQASGLLRDENGQMYVVFAIATAGGGEGELIVPRGLIIEPRKILSQLLNRGAKLQHDEGLEEVKKAIDNAPKVPNGLLVSRHGWHGDIYVTRCGVFGPRRETVIYRPLIEDGAAIGAEAGFLDGWRDGMREALAGSSYVTFVMSLAFGAMIAQLVGVEGGVFNLVGETTTFKTLVARGGQSIFGRAEPNDLASLALTSRAREELCASRSNGLVVADETARLDKGFSKKDVEELIYCIASGRGKIRSAVVAQNGLLANVTWHVFALLTSEISFDPKHLKGGAARRYAEIPVPPEKFGGVFDRTGLKGKARRERALQLARQLGDCITANYGVAFAPFMLAVAGDRQKFVERAKRLVEHFIERVGAKGDAKEERLARKFGIAFAGGVIAAKLGILPCESDHIFKSVSRLFIRSKRQLGGAEKRSPLILRRVAKAIRAGHFPVVKKGEGLGSVEKRLWGIRRNIDGNPAVVFQLSELVRLAGTRSVALDILAYWAKEDYLIRSPEGKNTREVQVTGWLDKRRRLICIKRSALPLIKHAEQL